jgi:hypothetical protein
VNARVVVRVNAVVILTLGVALAIPLVLSLLYADGSWASFLFPGAAMILAGAEGMMVTQASSGRAMGYVSNRDIYLSVTLAWVLASETQVRTSSLGYRFPSWELFTSGLARIQQGLLTWMGSTGVIEPSESNYDRIDELTETPHRSV